MAIRLSRTFVLRKLHQLTGIVPFGARAQRLTGYACVAFGVLLLTVGLNAAVSFIRPGGLLGGLGNG